MSTLGNHMRITVHPELREKVRAFYQTVLQCEILASPKPDLDLFKFKNNVIAGIYYSTDCLSNNDYLKATWLEIKSDNVEQLKQALIKAGVTEINYSDKSHFYFQAPGGQVYRLASEASD